MDKLLFGILLWLGLGSGWLIKWSLGKMLGRDLEWSFWGTTFVGIVAICIVMSVVGGR
jgi:hypothetical protein